MTACDSRGSAGGLRSTVARAFVTVRAWPLQAKAFVAVLVGYLLFSAAIVLKTPLVDVDAAVVTLQLRHNYQHLYGFLHGFLMLGDIPQSFASAVRRGPATLLIVPWVCWLAYRRRTPQPMVMLVVAYLALYFSGRGMKFATGRLGPRGGNDAYQMWAGGNIYPSGHVANAVVIYGLVALLVTPRFRLPAVIVGAVITVSISLSTLVINTHWLTDVIGGLFAGALVLTSLPWLVPVAERPLDAVIRRALMWRQARRAHPVPVPIPGPIPVPGSVPIPLPAAAAAPAPAPRTTPAPTPAWTPTPAPAAASAPAPALATALATATTAADRT